MSDVVKRRNATAKRVERKHACPNCGARFPFPNKLRLHINSNHSLANSCELCPERFNRFNELRTHMRHTHQILHQCHLCAYSSSVKAELKKHVVKCHENGVRCTVDGCDATVAYNRLRRHIRETHCGSSRSTPIVDDKILVEPENKISGDLLTEMFSSATEGSTFVNDSSRIKCIAVETMQGLTSNETSLKRSPQNAEAPIRLSITLQHDGAATKNDCNDNCSDIEPGKVINDNDSKNICQKEFSEVLAESGDLEMKQQAASKNVSLGCAETGGYECQKCGKIFYDIYNSRRHWNRVHLKKYGERVKLKKYTCKISECAQRFSCPSKLQDHMLAMHSNDAPFDCGTCNRKFSNRASFAVHLRRYHLVSIRNVPNGFTDGIGVSCVSVSDEIHIAAKDGVTDVDIVVADI